MSRPPLPIGAHGNIKTKLTGPKMWLAQCRYRDADGETRQVKRTGRSRSGAENALREALSDRRHAAGATITPESRIRDAATLWLEQRRTEVDGGDLSITSLELYESAWRLYVDPPLGGVRLREITVARCEAWKVALQKQKGPSAVKSARTVLSGILGYAARMGAIPTNPVRDLSRISGRVKRPARAMTRDERLGWLAAMEDLDMLREQLAAAELAGEVDRTAAARTRLRSAEKAVRWDIPDLTRFMLATGCRVGEALAVSWDEVDLDVGTVRIAWRIVPVKGEGLRRVDGSKGSTETRVQVRTLRVPRWCVDMLMHRRVDERAGWPVFPDSLGGWRYPNNVLKVLRQSRDSAGYGWVTSHVFRKTCLTILDEAKLTPRAVADQAGHSDPSMTQRVYMGRGIASEEAANALEDLL